VATFRFSTDDFSQRERLSAWREIFGRTVCNLDIEPLAADRFRSDATIYARPGLGVLAGSSSAVHLSHSKNLIVDDDLSFMTGSMPKWTAFQHDRNPVLGPGDGVLMNNAEVGSMLLPDTAAFITFKVPVKAIAPLVPDIGALIARRVPHDSQPLRLLVRYLGALQEEGALQSAELQRLAVTHVYDLFALALGATREAAEIANGRGLRAARLRAIKTDLAASLGRPEPLDQHDRRAPWHHPALRPEVVRDRGHDVLGIPARATTRPRLSHADRLAIRRPHRRLHRSRGRL
jgi:hypothetical protein